MAAQEPLTIGQFYAAIADQLKAAGEDIFTGDPARQVTHDLGIEELVAITDLESALAAIEIIVEQGEGTTQTPTDDEGELAHYYRFAEIYNGRLLVPNPAAPPDAPPDERYHYAGAEIPLDAGGVRPLVVNPGPDSYAAGSAARARRHVVQLHVHEPAEEPARDVQRLAGLAHGGGRLDGVLQAAGARDGDDRGPGDRRHRPARRPELPLPGDEHVSAVPAGRRRGFAEASPRRGSRRRAAFRR